MQGEREIDQNIRSLNSREKCYVRFFNTTEKTIDLMWINFFGVYIRYRILGKGEYIDVNTYKSHPWIAQDFMTKDMLHIDGQYLFQPKTTREILQERFPDRHIPELHEARTKVYISLPLYSLRYASLLALRNHILNTEDVDKLGLPKTLSEDLKKCISKRNRECSLQVLVTDWS